MLFCRCKGTTFLVRNQIQRPLHCKNLLTLRLRLANIIFAPRKRTVYKSQQPRILCDCDSVTISPLAKSQSKPLLTIL